MRCPIETPESAELLLAYCSRKLDAARTAVLEDHMEICPACREFAEGQRTMWRALDAWEAVPVAPDFDRRLYERIEKNVSWWDLMVRPFRPMMLRQGLPLTAAVALLIVAGVLIERPAGPSASPDAVQLEAVAPEQAEHALEEMEVLHEFNRFLRAESAGPRM
jgi:anti-sigma factor RsiW